MGLNNHKDKGALININNSISQLNRNSSVSKFSNIFLSKNTSHTNIKQLDLRKETIKNKILELKEKENQIKEKFKQYSKPNTNRERDYKYSVSVANYFPIDHKEQEILLSKRKVKEYQEQINENKKKNTFNKLLFSSYVNTYLKEKEKRDKEKEREKREKENQDLKSRNSIYQYNNNNTSSRQSTTFIRDTKARRNNIHIPLSSSRKMLTNNNDNNDNDNSELYEKLKFKMYSKTKLHELNLSKQDKENILYYSVHPEFDKEYFKNLEKKFLSEQDELQMKQIIQRKEYLEKISKRIENLDDGNNSDQSDIANKEKVNKATFKLTKQKQKLKLFKNSRKVLPPHIKVGSKISNNSVLDKSMRKETSHTNSQYNKDKSVYNFSNINSITHDDFEKINTNKTKNASNINNKKSKILSLMINSNKSMNNKNTNKDNYNKDNNNVINLEIPELIPSESLIKKNSSKTNNNFNKTNYSYLNTSNSNNKLTKHYQSILSHRQQNSELKNRIIIENSLKNEKLNDKKEHDEEFEQMKAKIKANRLEEIQKKNQSLKINLDKITDVGSIENLNKNNYKIILRKLMDKNLKTEALI